MVTRSGKAFTLVELIVVLAIVGILAAIAIPRFIDIRAQAYLAKRDGIVGSVRAGILTVATRNQVQQGTGTFPPDLELNWQGIGEAGAASGTADCLVATPCFELVIPGGYEDADWTQDSATKYTFTDPVGTATRTYEYIPATGTFR